MFVETELLHIFMLFPYMCMLVQITNLNFENQTPECYVTSLSDI